MADDAGDALAGQVLGQLTGLMPIVSRRVFGGVGMYSGRHLFGVVFRGALYLRADEEMRRDLARRGAGPFRPYRGRAVSAFWEVPQSLTGDKRRIRALARRALAASAGAARSALVARPKLAAPVRRSLVRAERSPPRSPRPAGRRPR